MKPLLLLLAVAAVTCASADLPPTLPQSHARVTSKLSQTVPSRPVLSLFPQGTPLYSGAEDRTRTMLFTQSYERRVTAA